MNVTSYGMISGLQRVVTFFGGGILSSGIKILEYLDKIIKNFNEQNLNHSSNKISVRIPCAVAKALTIPLA